MVCTFGRTTGIVWARVAGASACAEADGTALVQLCGSVAMNMISTPTGNAGLTTLRPIGLIVIGLTTSVVVRLVPCRWGREDQAQAAATHRRPGAGNPS